MAARIHPKRKQPLFLREWRLYRKLSREILAGRLGVSPVTVGRWENWDRPGGRRPDNNALAALAEALECDPGDLYRHPERPSADDLLRDQPAEVVEQAIKLIKAIRR